MTLDPFYQHLLIEFKFKGAPIFEHCRYVAPKNNAPHLTIKRREAELDSSKRYTVIVIEEQEDQHEGKK